MSTFCGLSKEEFKTYFDEVDRTAMACDEAIENVTTKVEAHVESLQAVMRAMDDKYRELAAAFEPEQ